MKKLIGLFIIVCVIAVGYYGQDYLVTGKTVIQDITNPAPFLENLHLKPIKKPDPPEQNDQKAKAVSLAKALNFDSNSPPDFAGILKNMNVEPIPVFYDLADVFLKLWNEDPMIRKDLSEMTYAVGHGLTTIKDPDRHNAWDTRPMTDWERFLYCMEDILHPKNKEKLKTLVLKVMKASEGMKGSDFLYGAQQSLASLYAFRNPKTGQIMDIDEIDYGLYRVLFQLNENFKPRDNDEIKMSEMRSILLALDAAKYITAPFKGAVSEFAFTSIMQLDPAGPDIETRDDAMTFFGGLLGKSVSDYPKEYHNSFQIANEQPRAYPDPLKGVDWFFYGQKFTMAGFVPVTGIDGFLSFVKKVPLSNYIMGVMTENIDSFYTISGSTGEPHTTGERHRLMAIAAPVLNRLYNQGYLPAFMDVFASLNEIPITSYESVAWNKDKGTLRQADLGTAMEVIEGPFGYGALYYMLRGASDARHNNDADFLDPLLDLGVRVLHKLSQTAYGDTNLLRGYYDGFGTIKLNFGNKSKEDIVEALYKENGPMDAAYKFIHDNHDQLVQVGSGWGKVLVAAVNQDNRQKNLFYTTDIVGLFDKNILPVYRQAKRQNNKAILSMAGDLKKMAGSPKP